MDMPAKKSPANQSKVPGIYLYDWSTVAGHRGKTWQVRVLDEKKQRLKGKSPMKSARFMEREKAEEWGKDTQAKLRVGQEQSGRVEVSTLLEEYLAGINKSGGSERNKEAVGYVLRRCFKESEVSNLCDPRAKARVQSWLDDLRSGIRRLNLQAAAPLSASTRRSHGFRVIAFGQWAEEMEYVTKNPFRRLRLPSMSEVPRRKIFSLDECRALARPAVRNTELGGYFLALLYGGLRRLEAAWLRREHFLTHNGVLLVNVPDDTDVEEARAIAAYRTARGSTSRRLARKRVKNNRSRMARLEPELAYILRPLLAGDPKGYVFPRSVRMMGDGNWTPRLHELCVLAGFAPGNRVPHCLRHTNACLLDSIGIGAATVRDHLGHRDAEMTAHYTHEIGVFRLVTAGWQGHIRLLGDEEGSPFYCTDKPVGNERATEPAKQAPAAPVAPVAEGCDDSAPIVITEDDNTAKIGFANPSQSQRSTAGSVASSRCESPYAPVMSYEYTRRNHTECLVQGDVMTFRWSALPLASAR